MQYKSLALLLGFVLGATLPAAAACNGADPALVSGAVTNVTSTGGLNRYHIAIVVANRGNQAQASNVLQFVDVYQGSQKLDDMGVPPLRPGQRYTVNYVSARSTEAGKGTTRLRFQLDMRKPNPPGAQDCDLTNNSRWVRF
jgi:hypothetical protein